MEYIKNNRVYSLLGQRGTFGTVLKNLARDNEKIIALSADLTRASGLEQFAEAYPKRLYNVGIAEENAVGMAGGLADQGYIPFVSTFANFATLRANEFVRHFMAYMKCNIKLVGMGSGFAMELFGNTHYGLEDISTIRSMPNIMIFSPADGLEVAKIVDYAANNEGPMYIRLSGKMNNPIVHKKDFDIVPGKAIKMSDGEDIVIFATGSMVSASMKAAKELVNHGISAAVYDVHTIKPFDCEAVINSKDKKLIVSVEEHCRIGGLGSAIAEVLAEQASHGELIRLGTGDRYEAAGNYDYMLNIHGLTSDGIVNTIIKKWRKNNYEQSRKVQQCIYGDF